MSTISTKLLRLLVAGAAAAGVPPDTLLAAAEVSADKLADPDGRMTFDCQHRLWEQAARLSGDALFGVHVAAMSEACNYGGLGFAVRSSATVGDAYRRIARFFQILIDATTIELYEDGALFRIRHVVRGAVVPPPRHAIECAMMVMLAVGRQGTGTAFLPHSLSLCHAAPSPTVADDLQIAVGAPVRFEQPHNELVIDRALLALPLLHSEPALCEILDRHLEELSQKLPATPTFLERVQGVLAEELRRGREPALPEVAKRLALSSRSLQRRLREEGTSLNQLLESLRKSLALRYLGEQKDSISEIAFLLGFSEVSTFHRAFKRWTGVTPLAYRQRGAAQLRP